MPTTLPTGNMAGDPVYPIAPGIVVAAGWSDDFGNYVMIEHEVCDNRFYSIYAHFGTERNSGVFVGVGEDVNSDTFIGTTGKTKGEDMVPAHLHFEVRTAGNVNLASLGPFQGMRFWGYSQSTWVQDFLDLGAIYGYDSDIATMPIR